MKGGDSFSLGASVRDIRSDSATVDILALGIQAGWNFGRVGPTVPTVKATLENRDYRKWASTPGGREDVTLGLHLDLAWPEIRYYGFSPRATLTGRRTWSDADIYDRKEISLGLTVVSWF